MTPPRKWPENAEYVRTISLSNVRKIREIVRYAQRISKELEVVKQLSEALEYTYTVENDLNSVGPKAEKEQHAVLL
jgi:hypothetical protein